MAVFSGPVTYWGPKWGTHWWVADFSNFHGEGAFELGILDCDEAKYRSDRFDIGERLLWQQTWKTVALEQNERRARLAMNRVGWQDCGAAWQEANSHAALVIGFCDLLEFASARISDEELERLEAQTITGCDYLALLQDRAAELGFSDGSISHQKPVYEDITTIGDATKAALAWVRASRLLSRKHVGKKEEYLQRAMRAYSWLERTDPTAGGFSRINHGAAADYVVPKEWMTRDLLMLCWAAIELALAGKDEFRERAVSIAARIISRQVTQEHAEGGFYGHFRTFEASPFTEKAWIHSVDDGKIGVDAGGHYPHYLVPLLQMCRIWPDHPNAASWIRAIHDFAYGYFLPACSANPFYLLPLGYFSDIGLLWFSGLWHGMNGAYALAAVLAQEFEEFFGDPQFRNITAGNLQWIAGLNAGITAESVLASHMYSADVPKGIAQPVSMIHGIGRRTAGSYLNVRGSICNGFSTGEQFAYDIEPSLDSDGPYTFTDEDWITHAGAWLGALARQ